ncbi:glycosyltransferase family 2 protein [Aequorivita sp. F47161]|uniref:Glycosyltransferase family 2 protein n=1 Tax=Aequorivita vitellina TaxID=2874475 RepID=A0A9X1QUR5_9FLAO|nr:glycosyltransferase family 2 protein [Aequorivita vitellina]MCG2419876.1 glycosyltransferase family 2 protein [Aequorivita vitellina]
MREPLVSIIIPTYNRAHLIGETLDSVLAQTYQNWECIVVDDGSTDHTGSLLKEYVERDDRFKYCHRPKDRPKGANACRNYGFELSKGEYINWFDSDDLMTEEKFFEQLQILENDLSLSFCTCEYGLYDKNFQLISRMTFQSANLLEDYIIGQAFFNLPTSIFRKATLPKKPLDENLFKAQEMEFFFRYLQQDSNKYGLLNKEFVKVRIHEHSITNSFKLGNKKAIYSEMKVRLLGLKILKEKSSIRNLNIALNHYMRFLKVILVQRKMKMYYQNLYTLRKIVPLGKLIKLVFIGSIFRFTGKGLYFFRNHYYFK